MLETYNDLACIYFDNAYTLLYFVFCISNTFAKMQNTIEKMFQIHFQ